MTQNDIYARIESLIPAELYERYTHLSYAEMAERPELAQWRDELLTAEREWFESE
jgi:aryl carrier-like protein